MGIKKQSIFLYKKGERNDHFHQPFLTGYWDKIVSLMIKHWDAEHNVSHRTSITGWDSATGYTASPQLYNQSPVQYNVTFYSYYYDNYLSILQNIAL